MPIPYQSATPFAQDPSIPSCTVSQEADPAWLQRSLEQLIHKTAHDLTAPLASISGLTQIARLSQSQEEIHHYLDLIQGQSNKLMGLLGELVEVGQLQSRPPVAMPLDLKSCLEDALASVSEWPETRDMNLELQSEPFETFLDAPRLRSMVQHLLANAIHFQDPAKPRRWVKIKASAENGFIRLEIKDNGKGMSEAFLPTACDLFSRGDHTSSGSGLGLYLVKEAARSMGASLRLESVMGKGTRVILSIPHAGKAVTISDQPGNLTIGA